MTEQRFPALRHRNFRLYWFGQMPSVLGTQMRVIALNWHVFDLLRDTVSEVEFFGRTFAFNQQALGLGMLGLTRIIPILLFALLGGAVADTRDRRKILIVTQTVAIFISAILAYATLTGNATVGLLYAMSAATAMVTAFTTPAQQSLVPLMVPKKDFANAVSLNTILFYIGSIAGPGIAAALIAQFDVGFVYLVDSISFVSGVIAFSLLQMPPFEPKETRIDLQAIIDGIRFTYRQKVVWSTMLIDFWATFFSSARTLLPLVAENVLGMGVGGYGVLATAQPIGAVVTGFVLSYRGTIRKQGLVLFASVIVYGAATAIFGISTAFWLSYVMFALTGAGDTVSSVIRGTIRQMATPDEMRGRMTSFNMMFFMGGPSLGELEAGFVAALLGAPFAIASGGVATIAITLWLAYRYPSLREYDH